MSVCEYVYPSGSICGSDCDADSYYCEPHARLFEAMYRSAWFVGGAR